MRFRQKKPKGLVKLNCEIRIMGELSFHGYEHCIFISTTEHSVPSVNIWQLT